jgi:quercetin dioxygenase-like cupin family protein
VILALFEHPDGVETQDGACVVYDLERGTARLGAARVDGPALVWRIAHEADELAARREPARPLAPLSRGPEVQVEVELARARDWLVRCDRVEFPPGGVAYRHVHPGPGIRRLLHGALTIDRGDGQPRTYRGGEAWFEGAEEPVLATASASEETAFVRVLLLPAEWRGRRTIRYLDPADEERPKLQRATILLEEPLPR